MFPDTIERHNLTRGRSSLSFCSETTRPLKKLYSFDALKLLQIQNDYLTIRDISSFHRQI